MAEIFLLVNGVPGAGKTTLARALAAELDVPLISKDAIKEWMSDVVGGRIPSRRLGQVASEAVWELASALETTVIVESNLYGAESREWTVRGLARSGRPHVIELWCEVPVALANARYDARVRHPIHPTGSERSDASAAADAVPLDIGAVLRVDTTSPVNVAALAASVRDEIRTARTLGR